MALQYVAEKAGQVQRHPAGYRDADQADGLEILGRLSEMGVPTKDSRFPDYRFR